MTVAEAERNLWAWIKGNVAAIAACLALAVLSYDRLVMGAVAYTRSQEAVTAVAVAKAEADRLAAIEAEESRVWREGVTRALTCPPGDGSVPPAGSLCAMLLAQQEELTRIADDLSALAGTDSVLNARAVYVEEPVYQSDTQASWVIAGGRTDAGKDCDLLTTTAIYEDQAGSTFQAESQPPVRQLNGLGVAARDRMRPIPAAEMQPGIILASLRLTYDCDGDGAAEPPELIEAYPFRLLPGERPV